MNTDGRRLNQSETPLLSDFIRVYLRSSVAGIIIYAKEVRTFYISATDERRLNQSETPLFSDFIRVYPHSSVARIRNEALLRSSFHCYLGAERSLSTRRFS
jgi:hypothetical protein